MLEYSPQECLLDLAVYEKSQNQLRQFKSRLPADSVEDLAREVIRRLAERETEVFLDAPSDDQIRELCHALISEDDAAGAAYIQSARCDGVSIDAVYLKYLSRAARLLGDWWDDNRASFSEVTLGTSRMYAIMRAMRHQMPVPTSVVTKSAVFASVPGETHTLGLRMATDLFRKDGWEIDLKIGEDHDMLVSEIVKSKAPLVGISAGGEHSLRALSRLVLALRIKQPETPLFVSGPIVDEASGAIELIGVNGMARDFEEAKACMNTLWSSLNA